MNLNNRERSVNNRQQAFGLKRQKNSNLMNDQITRSVRMPMKQPMNIAPNIGMNNTLQQQNSNMMNSQFAGGFGQKTIPMTVNQLNRGFNNSQPYQQMRMPQQQMRMPQQQMRMPQQQMQMPQQQMQMPQQQMQMPKCPELMEYQQSNNQEFYNNRISSNKNECESTYGFNDKSISGMIQLINTIKTPTHNTGEFNYNNNFSYNSNQPTVHQQYFNPQKNILSYEQAISFERLRDKLISLDDLLKNDGISRDTYKKIKTEILLKEV